MRSQTILAIILNKRQFTDNHHSIELLSPQKGRFNAISKHTRNLNNKLSGSTEPLNVCQLQIYETPKRISIIQSIPKENFPNIKSTLNKSIFSQQILKILLPIHCCETDAPNFFNLLLTTLKLIEYSDHPETFFIIFKLKLLNQLGIFPSPNQCSTCKISLLSMETSYLNSINNFQCNLCLSTPIFNSILFNNQEIKLLTWLKNNNLSSKLLNLKLSLETQSRLNKLSHQFLANYFPNHQISEKTLNQILP